MIVCICNRLNESKIRSAIEAGAGCPDDVYACNGVKRKCGTCQETIRTMLDAEKAALLQAAE